MTNPPFNVTSIRPDSTKADAFLVAALCQGDEAAFVTLITRYHHALIKLALLYVGSQAVAEEVVQETWLGVLKGIHRFEGRSSLKTWVFRMLVNIARTRGAREGRSIPFSALDHPDAEGDEPAVEAERFHAPGEPYAGWWVTYPRTWDALPEERLLSQEIRAVLQEVIDALPPSQRTVISLRDVEGWTVDEVCAVLGVSEGNQRVLLHRARAKVRRRLEQYLDES